MDFSIRPESEARLRAIEEFIRARLLPRETALLSAGFGASEPELEAFAVTGGYIRPRRHHWSALLRYDLLSRARR